MDIVIALPHYPRYMLEIRRHLDGKNVTYIATQLLQRGLELSSHALHKQRCAVFLVTTGCEESRKQGRGGREGGETGGEAGGEIEGELWSRPDGEGEEGEKR